MPAPVAGSWGPLVEAWSTRWLGAQPRWWQRRVWDRALAFGDDGRLLHRIYLASTGRALRSPENVVGPGTAQPEVTRCLVDVRDDGCMVNTFDYFDHGRTWVPVGIRA